MTAGLSLPGKRQALPGFEAEAGLPAADVDRHAELARVVAEIVVVIGQIQPAVGRGLDGVARAHEDRRAVSDPGHETAGRPIAHRCPGSNPAGRGALGTRDVSRSLAQLDGASRVEVDGGCCRMCRAAHPGDPGDPGRVAEQVDRRPPSVMFYGPPVLTFTPFHVGRTMPRATRPSISGDVYASG